MFLAVVFDINFIEKVYMDRRYLLTQLLPPLVE